MQYVLLQFQRSEAQDGSQGAKIKVQGCFHLEAPGENQFPCLFQLQEVASILWLLAISL